MHHNLKQTCCALVLITMVVSAGALGAEDRPGSASLWGRKDRGFLCAGAATPVWIAPNVGAFAQHEALVLTLTMDARIDIGAHGTAASAFTQPQPLIVPDRITRAEPIEGRRTWRLPFQVKPAFSREGKRARLSLLLRPDREMPLGPTPVDVRLSTPDAAHEWPQSTLEMTILPPLHSAVPRRTRIGAFIYTGYENPAYREAIVDLCRQSGMNELLRMHPWPVSDEGQIALFRSRGGRAGAVHISSGKQAVLDRFPEARRRGPNGKPVEDEMSYCWALENHEAVIRFLADFFRRQNTPKRYDIFIDDIEERALHKGVAYGDLHSPATMRRFRKQAGIAEDVELTPEIIVREYPQEWVDFRCWESTQWAKLVSQAVRRADPSAVCGYYSGYHNAAAKADRTGQPLGTRAGYSTDWELLGQAGFLDFGSAGYFGQHRELTDTRRALGDVPFVPGEMFIENFLRLNWQLPSASYFTRRLMWAMLTGGGHGVYVWYLQVLDAAGYAAIDTVAYVASQTEDIVLDGEDCADELALPEELTKCDVFAYRLEDRRAIFVLNGTDKTVEGAIGWRSKLPEARADELLSREQQNASEGIKYSVPSGGVSVFMVRSTG